MALPHVSISFDLREGGQYRMFFYQLQYRHAAFISVALIMKSLKTVYYAIPMSSMYLNLQVKLKCVLNLKKYLSVRGSYYAVWFARCDSCRWLLSRLAESLQLLAFLVNPDIPDE